MTNSQSLVRNLLHGVPLRLVFSKVSCHLFVVHSTSGRQNGIPVYLSLIESMELNSKQIVNYQIVYNGLVHTTCFFFVGAGTATVFSALPRARRSERGNMKLNLLTYKPLLLVVCSTHTTVNRASQKSQRHFVKTNPTQRPLG